jgi:hypothetical protein
VIRLDEAAAGSIIVAAMDEVRMPDGASAAQEAADEAAWSGADAKGVRA